MSIIETNLKFNGPLYPLDNVTHIVLHHAAGDGSVEAIHNYHQNHNGWSGIGYQLYVRKNGRIYRGRPIDKQGAQVAGHNRHTVGICFEGDFTKETMTPEQIAAGREAVAYCKSIYPSAAVVPHNYFGGTACPGANFPFAAITEPDAETAPEEADSSVPSKWATDDWAWACDQMRKYFDGTNPHGEFTREQAAVALHRFAKHNNLD